MVKAYRGYIGSKMAYGRSVSQNVQQQIIRDYCAKNGLQFLLSATEFEGSTVMLDSLIENLSKINGIVFYSLFLLPKDKAKQYSLFHELWILKKELHFAAENMAMRTWHDYENIQDLCSIMEAYESNTGFVEKVLKEQYA